MPPRRPSRFAGKPGPRPAPAANDGGSWLYGRHTVVAALRNPERHWRRLKVLAEHHAAATVLGAVAAGRWQGDGDRAEVEIADRAALEQLLPQGAVHQGWALDALPLPEIDLDDVLRRVAINPAGTRAVLILLDQVTDPHNVGAVLRTAAAFGAAAVIVTARHAPPATAALAKAASGGLDLVPLVRVANLAATLERLKAEGFWSCGLDADAAGDLAAVDLGPRAALVLGSEGGGLRRLVQQRCDHLARLPTRPPLTSLNVSNAAAVALYELVRATPG